MVTPVTRQDLLMALDALARQMTNDVRRSITDMQQLAAAFVDGRAARRITERILMRAQRVDDLSTRLARATSYRLQKERTRIDHATALLTSLHPLAPLQRGYAVIERAGLIMNAAATLAPGDKIDIRRQHDVVQATVDAITNFESTKGTSHGEDKG
jgi:exodeoxyribonuclease VII large subunit